MRKGEGKSPVANRPGAIVVIRVRQIFLMLWPILNVCLKIQLGGVMSKLIRNWYRRISGGPDVTVEISEKGVLRVNATRLLSTEPAKRQVEATQRLQRSHSTTRQKLV